MSSSSLARLAQGPDESTEGASRTFVRDILPEPWGHVALAPATPETQCRPSPLRLDARQTHRLQHVWSAPREENARSSSEGVVL
jgi:hypothetical protein